MVKRIRNNVPSSNSRSVDYERLRNLVETAQGERTLRQYALDAKVDYAVLYRMTHPEKSEKPYRPGISVLQRLGSPEASPRGGVTTADLMAAAGFTDDSLLLMKSALSISHLMTSTAGGFVTNLVGAGAIATFTAYTLAMRKLNRPLSSTEQTKIDPELTEYVKALEKHKTTARGILYAALALKGITFQPGNNNEIDTFGFRPDDYITIFSQDIKLWWFKYFSRLPNTEDDQIPLTDQVSAFLQQVVTAEPDKTRKISFIVADPESYSLFMQYAGHNSYRGNLSVIQIDTENVSIVSEARISTYDESRKDNPLSIL